jgi:hypothetical protein
MTLAVRPVSPPGRWCLHSYYSLCPYAPDGSDRFLAAAADLFTQRAQLLLLDGTGRVLTRWGDHPVTSSFWHTGLWQSWGADPGLVYHQAGSLKQPLAVRRDLTTGSEVVLSADLEGAPATGEPAYSCSHSLLYAAGYGDGHYRPEHAAVPFQARDRHGISRLTFDPPRAELVLSTAALLERHPCRDRLLAADTEVRARYGPDDGLTLMTYALRWNRQGTRCLFFYGNHTVSKIRHEPRLAYVFTADRHLRDVRLALDLSDERRGVHWSWQADGERLIGYGPDPARAGQTCLAEVDPDGAHYRKLSDHRSGGHPSSSPADPDLIVTDEGTPTGGAVVFLSRRTGAEVARVELPRFLGEREPPGRNPWRVCHHPVFNRRGDRVLANTLPGPCAQLVEIVPPGAAA